LHTVISAVAFRTLSVRSLRVFIDGIFTTIGRYPLTILSAVTNLLLTFVLPLAFVACFPATVLLRRTGELSVPPALAAAAPAVGFALFGGVLWY
jgi:ABC-2 type transport system permease protein